MMKGKGPMSEPVTVTPLDRQVMRAACQIAIDAGREWAFVNARQQLSLLDMLDSAEARNREARCVYCGWTALRGDDMTRHVKECAERAAAEMACDNVVFETEAAP